MHPTIRNELGNARSADLHRQARPCDTLAPTARPAMHHAVGIGGRKLAAGQSQPASQEVAVNHINRMRRAVWLLAGLVSALLAFGAASPAALASLPPHGGGTGVAPVPSAPVRIVAAGGMPGWQITLIALGAALFAAAAAVLIDRALVARRRVSATAA